MKRTALLIVVVVLCAAGIGAGAGAEYRLDWSRLRNPVLEYPNWSVKDYGVAYRDGVFYLFFSAFYEDDGRVRSHVVEVSTRDFVTYSDPILNFDGEDDGWIGMCSPNVTKVGGTYYLTFNSWGDKEGRPNQLFYMSSTNLTRWSKRKPLAQDVTRGVRAIDSALAFENGKYYVFWKEHQVTRCCVGESIDGPYRVIGDGYPKFRGRDGQDYSWHENYQLIKIDGRWRLVATTKNPSDPSRRMMPVIYTMKGAGTEDHDWLTWVGGYEPVVAREKFNTDHVANSGVLLDLRDVDGWYYLLYAGRTEHDTYLGRGWNRLGISRSRDLEKWVKAGEGG